MKRPSAWLDECAAWWAGYYTAGIKRLGLSAKDGDLSHTKVFGYAVLTSYLLGSSLPASVAMTLIISAHGTKALMEAIRSGVFSAKAEDHTNLNITRSKTEVKTETLNHNINENWNSDRGFDPS